MPKFSYQLVLQKNTLQQCKILSNLGYDSVELMINNPNLDSQKAMKQIINTGISVSAIGTGLAARKGLTLNSKHEIKRVAAEKFLLKTIDIANTIGTNIIIASIMGNCKTSDDKLVKKSLTTLANKNEDYGLETTLLLEPRNRYETQVYRTTLEIEKLIECLPNKQIGLLLDTFHSNIEEKSIAKSIIEAKYLQQVHCADNNRQAIGKGHIDFTAIFEALNKIGFNKVISMEYETSDFKIDAKKSLKKAKRLGK